MWSAQRRLSLQKSPDVAFIPRQRRPDRPAPATDPVRFGFQADDAPGDPRIVQEFPGYHRFKAQIRPLSAD